MSQNLDDDDMVEVIGDILDDILDGRKTATGNAADLGDQTIEGHYYPVYGGLFGWIWSRYRLERFLRYQYENGRLSHTIIEQRDYPARDYRWWLLLITTLGLWSGRMGRSVMLIFR